MSIVPEREEPALCETLTIDRETSQLLRQHQQKNGQSIEMLVKQAVETMYRDIKE